MNKSSLKSQLAFTLVELMISLTLGLVIMLAAVQLLVSNQIGYTLQRSMGDVQENGRFALDYISSSVRSAGYAHTGVSNVSLPALIVDTATLPTATTNPNDKVSCNDCFELTVASTVVKSDRLVVRQSINPAAGEFRSCEGNVIAAPANGVIRYVVTRYFVREDGASNSTAALACDAGYYDEGAASITDFGDGGVVLLSNIDSFQVQFGVATGGAAIGTRFPVRYVNLATYNTLPAPRPALASVRLAVYVRSADKVTTLLPVTNDMKVLDYTVSKDALTDKVVRRLFSTTLALRNAM